MQSSIVIDDEKIIKRVAEVLEKHGLKADLYLTPRVIKCILCSYTSKVNYIKINEIEKGELDTFKIASILILVINRSLDIEDETEKAQIALDVAYSFIEKPYYNVGPNYDEPVALEEVDFNECFENDQDSFKESNTKLLKSLIFPNGEPINYYNSLEMLYRIALLLKHADDKKDELTEEIPITTTKTSLTKRFMNLFKKRGA